MMWQKHRSCRPLPAAPGRRRALYGPVLSRPLAALLAALLCGPMVAPATVQDPSEDQNPDAVLFEKEPPRRGSFRDRPSPEALREKIRALRENAPNDPRIRRFEKLLAMLEDGSANVDARHRRGEEPVDPAEVDAFIEAHPELNDIVPPQEERWNERPRRGAGGRKHGGRPRWLRPVMRIMAVIKSGDTERAEQMIESVKIQRQIWKTARKYHRSREQGDTEAQQNHRQELAGLVEQQVKLEHEIKGMELQNLRERLAQQTSKHQEQAEQLDQHAERRLQDILDGKHRRRGGSGRGARGLHGRHRGNPSE